MHNYKLRIIAIGIIAGLFMSWFLPYIKHEILTWQYGKEFIGLHKMTNMIDDVNYLKVLDYSESSARVYYVGGSGDILTLAKNREKWDMISWDTIWSKTGSSDDFIWPYFYHSSEGMVFGIAIGIFLFIIVIVLMLIISIIQWKINRRETG